MEKFKVNIIGLGNKTHQFEYELNDAFFQKYGAGLVPGGQFLASVVMDKHETFIETTFNIKGKTTLVCDRSLEEFEFPIDLKEKIIFKYGQEEKEIDEEVCMITQETESLELGQFMVEFISLAIPMKKLHPKFQDDEDDDQDEVIYSSGSEKEKDEIDPRWEALKKLNKN